MEKHTNFVMRIFSWSLSFSLKKKILLILFIVVLFGGGVYFKLSSDKKNGYIVEPVKRASITEIVSDSGKVVSGGAIDVTSPTNGFIAELFVENGQQVKVNDKLFTVQSSATAQEKQSTYSNYLSAVSALKTSQSLLHSLRSTMFTDWNTFYKLATSNTYEKSAGVPDEGSRAAAEFHSTKEDWLAAERRVIDQDTAIAANQAAVSAAWTAYQATQTSTVTAQVPGVVENISVSIGNSVTAPSILVPSVIPVLTLVTNSTPGAMLAIGQTNITKVKMGQKAIIRPDSYKNNDFDGSVLRVDRLGRNYAGVVSYNVYLTVNDPLGLLRPEMTVDGDIITKEKKGVLTVPNSAVVLYKGNKAVRVVKGKEMKYIPVTVGIKGESKTEITGGVVEGQQIIVALTNEKAPRQNFLGL